jgi:cell wall-associated NlpC family hydrolase
MFTIINTTPEAVVAEARKHEGEPYRHRGRTELGRDCLGLLLAVAKATGQLEPDFDYRDYTQDASTYQLVEELSKKMLRLDDWTTAQPGDVLLQKFHVALPASHIVILTERRGNHLWGIHASRFTGRCVEQIVRHYERIHAAFRLKGVVHG